MESSHFVDITAEARATAAPVLEAQKRCGETPVLRYYLALIRLFRPDSGIGLKIFGTPKAARFRTPGRRATDPCTGIPGCLSRQFHQRKKRPRRDCLRSQSIRLLARRRSALSFRPRRAPPGSAGRSPRGCSRTHRGSSSPGPGPFRSPPARAGYRRRPSW